MAYYPHLESVWWSLVLQNEQDYVGRDLGAEVNRFSYTVLGGKEKKLKFTEPNVARLLAEAEVNGLKSLTLNQQQPEDEYLVDTTFMALAVQGKPYGRFYVNLPPNSLPEGRGLLLGKNSIMRTLLDIGPVGYGLVHPMERQKWPSLYFGNLETPGLSSAEKVDLQTWWRKGNQFGEKVRDVYWGNILSLGHLSNNRIIDQLRELIGPDNVAWISGDALMFLLPVELKEAMNGTHAYLSARERVRDLFREHQLLLEGKDPNS